jgi:hypothetical protein
VDLAAEMPKVNVETDETQHREVQGFGPRVQA